MPYALSFKQCAININASYWIIKGLSPFPATIAKNGLGQKSVKVQGLGSDLLVRFTENGSRLKSVK
jgi:hypothetical protein